MLRNNWDVAKASKRARIDDFTYREISRKLHHLAHDIQINMINVLPLTALETSLHIQLEDYESVTDTSSYQKTLESPIYAYINSKFALTNQTGGNATDSQYLDYLQSFLRQIISETRRNQLTKRQIEVIRDELFMVLAFTAFWMVVMSIGGFLLADTLRAKGIWWFASINEKGSKLALIAGLGGITGAYISAYLRIGDISQSGVTSRNLSQLAGAGKPLFQSTGFGCCAGALFFLLISYGGLNNFGPFDFQKANPTNAITSVSPVIREQAATKATEEITSNIESLKALLAAKTTELTTKKEEAARLAKIAGDAPPNEKDAANTKASKAKDDAATAEALVAKLDSCTKKAETSRSKAESGKAQLINASEIGEIVTAAEKLGKAAEEVAAQLASAREATGTTVAEPSDGSVADLSQIVSEWRSIEESNTRQKNSYSLFPLLLGLFAGFSERLIPDVIDQFRRKK